MVCLGRYASLGILFSVSRVVLAQDLPASGQAVEGASVKFSVTIFSLFKKSGQFGRLQTTFLRSGTAVKVDATIATDSVVMRSKSDAALLMSGPYFDAKRYPEIRFVSDAIPYAILGSGGKIQGNLSLRGKTLKQEFLVHKSACVARSQAAPGAPPITCVIEIEGSLRRSEFGMTARRGIVSDRVDLSLRIPIEQASLPSGKPDPSPSSQDNINQQREEARAP